MRFEPNEGQIYFEAGVGLWHFTGCSKVNDLSLWLVRHELCTSIDNLRCKTTIDGRPP